MQLFKSIVAVLALITPIYGANRRCNHYVATAATINNIQCGKSSFHNECNNICEGWRDRLRAISLDHASPSPGDPWGSTFLDVDLSHSACNGPTGLDPTTTPCTCTARLWRGRSYLMPIKPTEGDPSWDYDNLSWDHKFVLFDQEKVRCGGN